MSPLPPRPDRPSLDIVIPCYNEEAVLPVLLPRLAQLNTHLVATGRLSQPARIILVDDGSSDGTRAAIQSARAEHPVEGVNLSRNHGHQGALLAGLMHATADVVISMDADLQDDPDATAQMLDAHAAGAEVVFGVRNRRDTDTRFKRTSARAYYAMLRRLGVDIVPDHADYRLMSRKALSILAEFPERNLFLRALVRQVGLPTAEVYYTRAPRAAGHSKYPLGKMLAFAAEGVTSFSIRPLRLISWTGFAIAGLSMAYVLFSIAAWMAGATVPGWASTVVPIYFLGGMHLIALGIVGEYIGKLYTEVKARPRFIVEDIAPRQAAPTKLPVAAE